MPGGGGGGGGREGGQGGGGGGREGDLSDGGHELPEVVGTLGVEELGGLGGWNIGALAPTSRMRGVFLHLAFRLVTMGFLFFWPATKAARVTTSTRRSAALAMATTRPAL